MQDSIPSGSAGEQAVTDKAPVGLGDAVAFTDSTRLLYEELLFAVCRKFPGESRHQTALRYILQAEAAANSGAECSIQKESR